MWADLVILWALGAFWSWRRAQELYGTLGPYLFFLGEKKVRNKNAKKELKKKWGKKTQKQKNKKKTQKQKKRKKKNVKKTEKQEAKIAF